MKIIALNGTYRPQGTTTRLTEKALEGARSLGADTRMILLQDHSILYCTNCLQCYRNKSEEIPPCPRHDDVDLILAKIREADGVLLATPLHSGFMTGLMTAFFERIGHRVCLSRGSFHSMMPNLESRLNAKPRAVAAILNAGGVPARLRKHCDFVTPWFKECALPMFYGEWVGDLYAGAELTRLPETEEDWARLYFSRKLSDEQLDQAFQLGVNMAERIRAGKLVPVTLEKSVDGLSMAVIQLIGRFRPFYKTANSG